MADFKQAIKWMKEGRKVKSERYFEGDYFYIKNDIIMFSSEGIDEDEKQGFELDDFEATDWEIYCEEHDWENLPYCEPMSGRRRCKDCGAEEIMYEKKETLSDKICNPFNYLIANREYEKNRTVIKDCKNEFIKIEDVKEAVRKLKELDFSDILTYDKYDNTSFMEKENWINKLKEIFGDKLI